MFHKRQTLYALDLAREAVRSGQRMIVAEGYMDVIALHQAGFTGAVAPLGTALTAEQLAEIWRLSPEPVLCFDGDAAGARAAERAISVALPLLAPGYSLKIATLPANEDPDSLVRGRGRAAFEAYWTAALPFVEAAYAAFARGVGERAGASGGAAHAAGGGGGSIPDRILASEFRSALPRSFLRDPEARRPGQEPGRNPRAARKRRKSSRRNGRAC